MDRIVGEADLYRCRGIEVTPLDSSRVLVTTLADREQVVMNASVANLASGCRRFASLQEHATMRSDDDRVMVLLRGLVDGGLLISKRDFVETLRPECPVPPGSTLRTIGMPTCDRIEAVRRGLDSYLSNAIRHGRPVRAIVTDDTRAPDGQLRCREVLRELAQCHGREVLYAGVAEKRAFIDRLAVASGVARPTLDFAFFGLEDSGPTFGANRNALYLASIGESFFSADDDTVGSLLAPEDAEQGMGFSSYDDPTRVRMFKPGEALNGQPQDVDLLTMLEQTLGRSVADLVPRTSAQISLDDCEDDLMALLERGEGRVRLSWIGIAGDSGAGSAEFYMHLPHTQRSGMRTDDDYRAYCQSRLIFRAPTRLVVSSGTYCQTTALAFDGAGLLPPYFPTCRGEDLIFGRLLRIISPASLTAYHPLAISHVPHGRRTAVPPRAPRTVMRGAFHTFVRACLDLFVPLPGLRGETSLLEEVGRHLCAVGTMSPSDFTALVRTMNNRSVGRAARALEHHLLHDGALLPPAYRKDLRATIEMLLAGLERPVEPPQEFADGRTPEQALAFTQRQLAAYGDLSAAWPAIVAASRALQAEGAGLAVRV
jgi:hypothetical protein